MDDGGPAFPGNTVNVNEGYQVQCVGGMTLRDYFAAKAMQGMLARNDAIGMARADAVSAWAYEQADAMLKARGGR